ncbi:reverse transcriptase [Tanacetum coccineum]|uniref:Reverse transcriptase n=1 Tax=Tanacetum coccineum TaxID=301880 RepID=A0ABQ5C9S2_9ASTR
MRRRYIRLEELEERRGREKREEVDPSSIYIESMRRNLKVVGDFEVEEVILDAVKKKNNPSGPSNRNMFDHGAYYGNASKLTILSKPNTPVNAPWLATLGDIKCKFKELRMEFKYKGKKVKHRGTHKSNVEWMNGKQIENSTRQVVQGEFHSMALSVYSVNTISYSNLEGMHVTVDGKIQSVLDSYEDVFGIPVELPPKRSHDHRIPLVEGALLVNIIPYRHLPTQKDAIETMVKELLEAGVIIKSHSPFASPIVMVKKKEDSWRMCVDYRSSYHQIKMNEVDIAKTAFWTHEGHVISTQGVATDPTKIQVVANWHVPSSLKQLRGFLGLTSYYRRFIKGFAMISRPLTQLLKKGTYEWNSKAQSAFEALKQAMISALVLKLPDFAKEFTIKTDASGGGIGAVLLEKGHLIAFLSKTPSAKHQLIIVDSWEQDQTMKALISKLQSSSKQQDHYTWHSQQLRRKGKLMVGNDEVLSKELLQQVHGGAVGGHLGVKVTTHKLLYGKPPPVHIPYIRGESKVDLVDKTLSEREAAVDTLKIHISRAQSGMKSHTDKRRTDKKFDCGDWVFLKLQPYKQISLRQGKQNKFSPMFFGPFKIIQRIGQVAYKLELPNDSQIPNVFHVSQLKKCRLPSPNQVCGNLPPCDNSGWANGTNEDATWESVTKLQAKFSSFDCSNAQLFDVHYDGFFMFSPLRYENGAVYELRVTKDKKYDYDGLKIVECDSDLEAMYEFADAYEIIQMIHENKRKDVGNMSYEELVSWAEEEAQHLKTPPKPTTSNAPDATLDVDEFDYGDTGASFESVDDQTGAPSQADNGTGKMIEEDNIVNKVVDKVKGLMIEEERPVPARKAMGRNKGIVIEENDNPNVMDSDSSDSEVERDQIPDYSMLYSDSESEYSDRSVDYLSEGEDELIQLRKRNSEAKRAPKVSKQKPCSDKEGGEGSSRPKTLYGLGESETILEHEEFMDDLVRKMRECDDDAELTDPFKLVETRVEKYPTHDQDTHWKMKKPKDPKKGKLSKWKRYLVPPSVPIPPVEEHLGSNQYELGHSSSTVNASKTKKRVTFKENVANGGLSISGRGRGRGPRLGRLGAWFGIHGNESDSIKNTQEETMHDSKIQESQTVQTAPTQSSQTAASDEIAVDNQDVPVNELVPREPEPRAWKNFVIPRQRGRSERILKKGLQRITRALAAQRQILTVWIEHKVNSTSFVSLCCGIRQYDV